MSSNHGVKPTIVKGKPSKPYAIVVLVMMGDSYILGMYSWGVYLLAT